MLLIKLLKFASNKISEMKKHVITGERIVPYSTITQEKYIKIVQLITSKINIFRM